MSLFQEHSGKGAPLASDSSLVRMTFILRIPSVDTATMSLFTDTQFSAHSNVQGRTPGSGWLDVSGRDPQVGGEKERRGER